MSGTMDQRPDQGYNPPISPVAPSQAAGILRARIVIISGSGVTGLFEYSGTPALGNPPVAYAAAPGVTTDPFGNALPATTGGFVTIGSATTWAQLISVALTFFNSANTVNPVVGGSGNSLQLGSGATVAASVQAIVNLIPAASAPASMQLGINTQVQFSTDTTLARTGVGVLTIGSTLIVGTILTNLLQLTEQAVPAATTSVQVVGNTSGHAEVVSNTTHGDSNKYDIERLTLRLTSTFTINNTIAQTIFSKALGVGTYEVEVWAVTQNTTAADAAVFAFSFSGTATGLVDYTTQTTGTAVVGYAASGTITTTFNGQGVGGNQQLRVNLTITVTVAGTLTFSGAELVAGNTITVSTGSRMRICPIVAT